MSDAKSDFPEDRRMTAQWVRAGDVVWEEVNGEAVLVSTSERRTLVLNATASFLWTCCDGSVSLDDVARRITAVGGRKLEQVRNELAAFCLELETRGVLLGTPVLTPAQHGGAVCFSGNGLPPLIKLESLSVGFRGRPSSRGISGQ